MDRTELALQTVENVSLHSSQRPQSPGHDWLRAPQFCVRPRSDGRSDLQLSGGLPTDWSLRLARALAHRDMSLLDGYARRIEPRAWLAELSVDSGWADPGEVDFLALATGSAHPSRGAGLVEPALLDFDLSASPRLGGALELQVDAWDAIGLLAAVLGRCAAVGLYPAEMILETEGECAFHHLTLKSGGWDRPSRSQALAVARSLGRLVEAR